MQVVRALTMLFLLASVMQAGASSPEKKAEKKAAKAEKKKEKQEKHKEKQEKHLLKDEQRMREGRATEHHEIRDQQPQMPAGYLPPSTAASPSAYNACVQNLQHEIA